MSSQEEQRGAQAQAQDAELNDFGRVAFKFVEYGANASRNLQDTFGSMTLQNWLRLVVIVGGYVLFRSQIMKYMSRNAVNEMEKRDAMDKAAAKAKVSPNELRSGKPDFVEEEDEDAYFEGQGTGADWGSKARTRQRLMLKKLMEAEERRKQEEDDDKDIADLLED